MMETSVSSKPVVDREKTAPFLIRAFVKIGGFHRLGLFEEGTLPTTDEQQLFTWRDATLREVLTTLRITSPNNAEYKHPLARYSFRALYADGTNRGRFAQKELGMIYSRDILGEPGSGDTPAARLLEEFDGEKREISERDKEGRTLEELRFVPGDYLSVAVLLPKSVTLHDPVLTGTATVNSGLKAGVGANGQGWRSGKSGFGVGDNGWNGALGAPGASGGPLAGRGGGGHWRGGSDAPQAGPGGRGRGGRFGGGDGVRRDGDKDVEDKDRNRDRDRDRRIPPPRRGRDSPPLRGGRGRDKRSPSFSRSRSRSPPKRSRRE